MIREDCMFCRILDGEIPADIIHESDAAIAFRDINPQAPTHVLIIPRRHISTINDLDAGDEEVVGSLFMAAKDIAQQEGLAEDGYRVVMNCGEGAGQSVFHIHLHLLGGRLLNWPPG
ncbi:MAG: histidine triad nucleotide-binding protein [Gammaproteobacteria bacterium]|nr:histidine triad nucleotide-binding protein [Gammaproteobacteria bacterium]MDH3749618.1 histidine triad nucleotide-binding protein [Gammaproteobacteria bacterium]MDH3806860.1 histidine triad nucleotide-binding protein [Gammaproteobacteria bacterium]